MVKKILFIGSKPLGLKILKEIHALTPSLIAGVLTLDDQSDTRTAFTNITNFAVQSGIPLHVAKGPKEADRIIRAIGPQLCVVSGWYWLFTDNILAIPEKGFIGIHQSKLPKYRGGSPIVWAIINGESSLGVSMFSFTNGMDDGDLWGQKEVPILDDDYVSDALAKVETASLELIRENYNGVVDGSLRPKPQPAAGATYCALRLPCDGRIDWRKTASDIYNFIRAQSHPYPGAFTIYNQKALTIWRARKVDMTFYGQPGQVSMIVDDDVYVICGDNKPLILETVSYEDKQNAPAKSVITSIKTRFSDV